MLVGVIALESEGACTCTCRFACTHEGLINTSFGAEDGLQQLQTVAHGLRYESASIYELSRACSKLRSSDAFPPTFH